MTFVPGGPNPDKIAGVVRAVMSKHGAFGVFNSEFLTGVAADLQNELEKLWSPGELEEWRLMKEMEAQTNELLVYWQQPPYESAKPIPDVYLRQVYNAGTRLERHRRLHRASA